MRKAKSTKVPEVKPKKEPTEFQKRARSKNLEKAREVNRKKQHGKDMSKIDGRLNDLSDEIDGAVEKQVKAHLGKVDRKKLKNEILQVFADMGGRKKMLKWAKENPSKYYSLVKDILKSETDNEKGGGGGVVVNLFGIEPDSIDITPAKES